MELDRRRVLRGLPCKPTLHTPTAPSLIRAAPATVQRANRRAEEKALTTVSDIVTEAVEALCGLHLLNNGDDDIPVFFFGHELGAVVAFEVCRRVHPEFLVEALFVSGMACPQVCNARSGVKGNLPGCRHLGSFREIDANPAY